MRRSVTYRIGAAVAAVVFAVTSGITAMEVHQLAAHGSQPLAAPDAPPTPVASVASGHSEHHPHGQDGHQARAAQAGEAHASHAAHGAPAEGDAEQSHEASHSGHTGHSEHGSTECTCVGPCASGAPPTLTEPTFAEMVLGEPQPVRVVAAPVDPVHQDPRSYLLPFSNAPPARV